MTIAIRPEASPWRISCFSDSGVEPSSNTDLIFAQEVPGLDHPAAQQREMLFGENPGRRQERRLPALRMRPSDRPRVQPPSFPEPTSPSSRRFIGVPESRSIMISAIAFCWAEVSE